MELLVVLVLLALLGGAVTRTLLQQRRRTHALLERAVARRTLDQASLWLSHELSEVARSGTTTDLFRVDAESVTYRAARGLGLACAVEPAEIRLPLEALAAWRRPQAGRDSLMVFLGTTGAAADPWLAGPILDVGQSACDGAPALRLGTALDATRLSRLHPPAQWPVRIFEVMQARMYRSQGAWWLGARSVTAGEAIQPVAGPLDPTLSRMRYRDSLGLPTLTPGAVREVEFRLGTSTDSIRLLLRPRNLQ
jgi:hypothetical protein